MDTIIELPEQQSPGRKIFVATPCYGCQVTPGYLASLVRLQHLCATKGVALHFEFVGNESLVERARNILVKKFLLSDSTHLLFTIWAATQTYADFDVQMCAVLGRKELKPADHARATEHVVSLVLRGCGLAA